MNRDLKRLSQLSLLIVIFISFPLKLNAQCYPETIKIEEYYWSTPLTKVLSDFKLKYNIAMEYDSNVMKKYKLDYNFMGTNVDLAFKIILRNIPSLSYHFDDRCIVHISETNVDQSIKEKKTSNIPYYGKAENYNIAISGTVKDIMTGEALPYASVGIKNTKYGASTNIDGYFTLFNVPADTSILIVQYLSYKSQEFYLNPQLVKSEMIIELIPEATELKEVEVKAQRELLKVSEGISIVKMTPLQVADLPSLGEKDIFRSFQLLPGISGSNESSAGLYVRGGTPDQNLILYDGFTVYHQEHLFGMYSAFNSNAIKDVQLYKGGFEAKYGGRISSVMEITGKTGNEKKFNIGGDLSLLSFNVFTEIPLNEKGSIFIAGRRSYKSPLYNKFFDAFNEDNEQENQQARPGNSNGNRNMETADPASYFYDLNAKFTYRPSKKDILSLSFFNGEDDLDNSRDMNRSKGGTTVIGETTDLTKWGNWGTSLKWSRKWNKKLYSNNLMSFSKYYSIRDINRSRTMTRDDETTTINMGTMEDNSLKDITFKNDNEIKTGKSNSIEFGLQYTNYNIDYTYTHNDTSKFLDMHDNANLASIYIQDKWKPFNNFNITPGIRYSYYSNTEKLYFEPRLQLIYNVSKKIKIKGAWGKYNQFANRVLREDILSGSRDFWVLSDNEEVPVKSSIHYILGTSHETDKYLFDVEAFYKDLDGLSEYTLRFAPQYGIEEVDYSNLFYDGSGYSRGIEFMAQKKTGKLTGWACYTLSQVRYNFPVYGDGYFPASHDVTSEFKIVGSYKIKHWTFSATWIYATGKPYTEPLGGYTITLADGTTSDFIVTGTKNGSRYPDYHRLDMAAIYNFKMGETAKGSIGFSIFNVYNRTNIWYKEFEIDDTGLTETNVNLLNFTPNLTLSLKLR